MEGAFSRSERKMGDQYVILKVIKRRPSKRLQGGLPTRVLGLSVVEGKRKKRKFVNLRKIKRPITADRESVPFRSCYG